MHRESERLNKFDVATRQLSTAILMFFQDKDPVSVHTVAAAAHELLTDLGKRKGVLSFLKDNPYLTPEGRKSLRENVRKAPNFFKHADKDPESVLDFNPERTVFIVLDAVIMHMQLSNSILPEGTVFWSWVLLNYPEFVADDPQHPQLSVIFGEARQLHAALEASSLPKDQKFHLHRLVALTQLKKMASGPRVPKAAGG